LLIKRYLFDILGDMMHKTLPQYHKAIAIFCLLFVGIPVLITAQDNNPDVDDWDDFRTELYARGDQAFVMSLGLTFPIVFLNNGSVRNMNFSSNIGGGGSLSYNYFLNSNVFFGAEIGGLFLSSITSDTLFIFHIGGRIGYQFLFWKLEVPVYAGLGMSVQRFLGSGYFGLYTKGGASAFYRVTTNWSFGLSTGVFWFPQWTSDKSKNMDGIIMDFTLSARYHF
jgi:hypothetical protein